jgi:hypothetical protein
MSVFGANINRQISDFLSDYLRNITSCEVANKKMYDACGVVHFFEDNEVLEKLKKTILTVGNLVEEPDRAEYGDFQTNENLANKVTAHLVAKNISPEIIIEPTCGKGNFIIAALENFSQIQHIVGVEIYKPYVWEAKFNILKFFLNKPEANKPIIEIVHCDVFDFDFQRIAQLFSKNEILIIGNPPWVTNSKLGVLNSVNLPQKSNFKKHSGLDAMTGKGNFDIAECITLTMINTFQKLNGNLLLLIKNSVIKNIVFDQKKNKYSIAHLEKYGIDSKKEFNVSVEASLFYGKLNSKSALDCKEYNFYDSQNGIQQFGWLGEKFVSNMNTYWHTKEIDGKCPFVWRQGLKHDCSDVMEFDKINGHYVNRLNEATTLEDGLVYGMLKSSDLKNTVVQQPRKYTIVTQKKVGQETKFIKDAYPKTYQYLAAHQASFDARKSSIYNNKPPFSIFGIGDYSFKPYKVAISGLYKTCHFTLVLPQNNKPIMLDDTCYLLGFDKIEFAVYTLILLNSETAKQFLQSVTFADAKRTFTKDVLMRIDMLKLAQQIDKAYLNKELQQFNTAYNFSLNLDCWESFVQEMTPEHSRQIELFH